MPIFITLINESMIQSIVASLIANAISNLLERDKFKCILKRLRRQINLLSNIPIIPRITVGHRNNSATHWY